jgi:hypothetical protein
MLEEAIDYVKYLQNQVKVHSNYPEHINNHIINNHGTCKTKSLCMILKKQKFPCNSFLATS